MMRDTKRVMAKKWRQHFANNQTEVSTKKRNKSKVDYWVVKYGFKPSQIDLYLFMKGSQLFCLYMDDVICLSLEKKDADKLIVDLEHQGYILTDKGPLSAYLRIEVDHLERN